MHRSALGTLKSVGAILNNSLLPADSSLLASSTHPGVYQESDKLLADLERTITGVRKAGYSEEVVYKVNHFFDEKTVTRVFAEAGFRIEDVYYYTPTFLSEFRPETVTLESFREKSLQVTIQVQKPL